MWVVVYLAGRYIGTGGNILRATGHQGSVAEGQVGVGGGEWGRGGVTKPRGTRFRYSRFKIV